LVGKKQKSFYKMVPDLLVIILFIFLVCFSGVSSASEKIIKRDIDNDSIIDQVAYVDADGNMIKLEIDKDADGHMEFVQYYENGHLIRTEKDTNGDRTLDIRNYFAKDRRSAQEKLDTKGQVIYVILFDETEKISEIKKDTNQNGSFDQHFFYTSGILATSTIDKTGDGNVNVWNTYQNKQVIYKKTDENGDGLPESEIFYDQKQAPQKSGHDLDADGYLETRREYIDGKLVMEKKDLNQDTVFDLIIEYKNGGKLIEARDSNFDGVDDIETRYENGKKVQCNQDSDCDGIMERTVFFDKNENPVKIILDTNGNNVPDQWQYFNNNILECFETDRNHDGKPDLKIFYANGNKQRMIKDDDFNDFFEITQRFEEDGWTVIVELDSDEDSHADSIFFYIAEALARKDVDENGDGRIDFREYYDHNGQMIKSEEAVDGAGCLNMVWYYDESTVPVRAEKDADGDGRTDVWYIYVANRLTNVREDTNHDGKPDVWEEFGAAEEMIRRSKDLNFDGIPDIKEDFTEADSIR
jgi:antitoxin component YwqK of YwqJK toxin-antitoxin module